MTWARSGSTPDYGAVAASFEVSSGGGDSGGGAAVQCLAAPRRIFRRRHHEPARVPRRFDIVTRPRSVGWWPKLITPARPRLFVPARPLLKAA